MEYRQLGRSGLKVSLHSLGTMNFAGTGFFEKVGGLQDFIQAVRTVASGGAYFGPEA